MKTDPNKGCANKRENFFWAFVHDCITHPFMALTNYSRISLRFHDYTSHKAWPRIPKYPYYMYQFYTRIYSKYETDMLVLQHIEAGFKAAGTPFMTRGSLTPHGYVYDVYLIRNNYNG